MSTIDDTNDTDTDDDTSNEELFENFRSVNPELGIIILGYDQDGVLILGENIGDGPEINWLLDKAKRALLNGALYATDNEDEPGSHAANLARLN